MSTKQITFTGALAVLAVVAQIGTSTLPRKNHTHSLRPRFHAINRLIGQHDENGASESSNWSGYAVTGSGFTRALGSWVVPQATCSSGDQYASLWVGIDGYNSGTVEQIGTNTDCVGSTASYSAWYEFCCAEPEITIPGLIVTPGNVIEAVVNYNGTDFVLSIKNLTTGKVFSKTGTIAGAERTSAEWIAEAPTSGAVLPLTDFGTALFGKDNTGVPSTNVATLGGASGAIGTFASFYQITMVGSSGSKAVPSILSSDQSSFSDTWVASQ